MMAGVAGAVTNNNTGIAGLAGGGFSGNDGIQIMTLKATNELGVGVDYRLAEAIRKAADPDNNPSTADGSDIINMSWGGFGDSPVIKAAIDFAYYDMGCILIASAANNKSELGHNYPFWGVYEIYPAMYDEVIAVAGSDPDDQKYIQSDFGSPLDVCAPAGKNCEIKTAESA